MLICIFLIDLDLWYALRTTFNFCVLLSVQAVHNGHQAAQGKA